MSLVGHAVRVGRRFLAASGIEGVVLVDTDDAAIASEGKRWGAEVPFLRPPELATDQAATADAVIAALDRLAAAGRTFDTVVLLQPTSPLRELVDIRSCVDSARSTGTALTVSEPAHPVERALTMGDGGMLEPLFPPEIAAARRQATRTTYAPDGSAYVIDVSLLRERRAFFLPGRTVGSVVPRARSVDIDVELDLVDAEALLRARPMSTFFLGGGGLQVGAIGHALVLATVAVNPTADRARLTALLDEVADAGADAVNLQSSDPRQAWSTDLLQVAVDHSRRRSKALLASPESAADAELLAQQGVDALVVNGTTPVDVDLLTSLRGHGMPLLVKVAARDAAEAVPDLDTFSIRCRQPDGVMLVSGGTGGIADVDDLRALVGAPVGLSDVSAGCAAVLAAVARGAAFVEKRVASSSEKAEGHALEPAELASMVKLIRGIQAASPPTWTARLREVAGGSS